MRDIKVMFLNCNWLLVNKQLAPSQTYFGELVGMVKQTVEECYIIVPVFTFSPRKPSTYSLFILGWDRKSKTCFYK